MEKIRIIVLAMLLIMLPTVSHASGIETDKAAHAACSYVICDQLQHAGMNRFWASATTLVLGAAKERWIDDRWDGGDFAADCAGVLFWQTKF